MKSFLVCAAFSICASALTQGGVFNSVVPLPNPIQPTNVVIRDSSGDLYLGGGAPFGINGAPGGPGAIVTKQSHGKIVYSTALSPGNPQAGVTGLALAPDGSILAVGLVQGSFGLTADAAETAPVGTPTGFVARLDVNGGVVYASYLNSNQAPSFTGIASPLAIATDATGAAYITGEGLFDSTPGALKSVPSSTSNNYFIVKLDQAGKRVWATGAIGGSVIAVGPQGLIYIAGSDASNFPLPVTPGAFQTVKDSNICASTPAFGIPCANQYAAKLDPSASRLIYCTWLSGSFGAIPSSLLIDREGNAILAGTTQSSDYPVTPGAFETLNFASAPPKVFATADPPCCFGNGPPYTGYVTKLNAAGTGLIFSTYLGGSAQDGVDAAGLDSEDNIYLSGHATSADFPGAPAVPAACKPSIPYQTAYLTRLGADGASLTGTQLAYGAEYALGFYADAGGAPPQFAFAAFDGQGSADIVFNGWLASLGIFGPTQNFACATDAADHIPLAQIAPGQLLTLYGTSMGEFGGLSVQPSNGMFPVSLGDQSAVKIHGIPAPILYSSASQINVQVPYEIEGQTSVKLEIDDSFGAVVGTRQFGVAASQPSAFLNISQQSCSSSPPSGFLPTARNADGSINSCANPAAPGSNVTIFLNGMGLAAPGLKTGAIATAPESALSLPITASGNAEFVSATSDQGSINGVWAVTVRMAVPPSSGVQSLRFTVSAGGIAQRDPVAVWVQ